MQKIRTRTKVLRIRRKDERGASAVEFAFILPVFLLLVLGIIQYGTIFLLRNQLTQAASDAARNSVTLPSESAALGNAQGALTSDIVHNGTGLVSTSDGCGSWTQSTDPTTGTITSTGTTTTGITCTVAEIGPGQPGCQNVPTVGYECLQVTVSYDYANHPILPLPFVPTPSTVKASSTVVIGDGALVK